MGGLEIHYGLRFWGLEGLGLCGLGFFLYCDSCFLHLGDQAFDSSPTLHTPEMPEPRNACLRHCKTSPSRKLAFSGFGCKVHRNITARCLAPRSDWRRHAVVRLPAIHFILNILYVPEFLPAEVRSSKLSIIMYNMFWGYHGPFALGGKQENFQKKS